MTMTLLKTGSRLALTGLTLLVLAACGGGEAEVRTPAAEPLLENLAPQAGLDASSEFFDPAGNKIGNVTVTDSNNGVLLRVDLKGISEGWHGIHLHQVGDCSDNADGFKASMGHINPDGNEHGLLNIAGFERGDLENIYARANGRVTAEIFNSYVRLNPSEAAAAAVGNGGVLMDADGFAVVVHRDPDDHMSQPIGNSGPRIACAAFR